MKKALTMIEILLAVALIAILAGGIFFVGGRAREHGRIEQTKSTLAMLDTALEQYYDFDKTYPPDVNYANGGSRSLPYAFEPTSGAVVITPVAAPYIADYPDAQSIEVAYYYLNRIPASRVIVSKLPESAVTAKAVKFENGFPLPSKPTDPNVIITIGVTNPVGLFRVVDAWNMPLQYTQYRANSGIPSTNFPLIRSAGPDRKFGTEDDIVNRKN